MADIMVPTELMEKLMIDLAEIKQLLKGNIPKSAISDEWIPWKEVMNFLSYGSTQMTTLEKRGLIVVAKIGKRKFVHKDSIKKLLNNA